MTDSKYRVLVLDQSRGVWGAQRYLLRLAPLLRDRGVELILANPRELELHSAWQDSGFSAVDLDLRIDRDMRRGGRPGFVGVGRELGAGLRMAGTIAAQLRTGDYDAVWANAHWTHMEAALASALCRKPVVLHLHEEAVPGLGQQIRTAAVRIATRTVAVSNGVAAGLPTSVRQRCNVIVNGVDTGYWSPPQPDDVLSRTARAEFGIGDSDVMVLAATRLDPSKRIEDLIAAVHGTANPRIHLVVAGETSGHPDYAALVKSCASGQVAFCGNRTDMLTLFRAADVVLHAGVVEGMPLGLLEAQACGTPVVAYAVAGVPEAVLDGRTGLLAAASDVTALTAALATLADRPELRTTMGAAARDHILARHQIAEQATLNACVINEMCGTLRLSQPSTPGQI